MLDEFNYRFVSRRKLLERGARALHQSGYPTSEDIRLMNNNTVERLKKELELHDDSTINDLRAAALKLADT